MKKQQCHYCNGDIEEGRHAPDCPMGGPAPGFVGAAQERVPDHGALGLLSANPIEHCIREICRDELQQAGYEAMMLRGLREQVAGPGLDKDSALEEARSHLETLEIRDGSRKVIGWRSCSCPLCAYLGHGFHSREIGSRE